MVFNDFTKWAFIFLLALILISMVWYFYDKKSYLEHRTGMRKAFYILVLLALYILWWRNEFPDVGENLIHLIALGIGIVLVDLFVFQTPDITKFLTNELKHEVIEGRMQETRGEIIELKEKLVEVNHTISQNSHLIERRDSFSFHNYQNDVHNYLDDYLKSFSIDLYAYHVKESNSETVFHNNVKDTYKEIIKEHEFKMTDIGYRKNKAVDVLVEGEDIEIFRKKKSSVIFSHYGEYYNTLYVITSDNKEIEKNLLPGVTGADATMILNLLFVIEMRMKYVQHQPQ